MLRTGEVAARGPRFEDVRGPGFSPLNVLLALLLGGVVVVSFQQTRVSLVEPFTPQNARNVARFVGGLFPPETSAEFLRGIGGLILETVAISVAGTALALVLAVPLALGAMRVRARRRRGRRWGRRAGCCAGACTGRRGWC